MRILTILFVFLCSITLNQVGNASMENSMNQDKQLPIRQSARLIILDSLDRVLLMQIKLDKPADPLNPISKPYWVTLGGGVDKDETLEAAAARELAEETGIKGVDIGPKIWHGQWKSSTRVNDETYFLVRLPYIIDQLNHEGLEEEEKKVIKSMKWWDLQDLKTSEEIFIPQQLGTYLEDIIKNKIPVTPLEIDVSTPKVK